MARVDFKNLEKFAERLSKIEQSQIDQFSEAAIKELAARLLRKVIKRTPVGEYDKPVSFVTAEGKKVEFTPKTGKMGGTLRRGWTAGKENTNEKGNVVGVCGKAGFANNLEVTKNGDSYVVTIINPMEYASYVEFGHSTSNHKGWVKGHFMLTISEQELERDAPRILEQKLTKFLGEVFK